ncbi:FMN-binding negative transcriptional regulator [Saprospira sp. CCB-QB6]|uniref:FMN-binding negative transcriptional regulator n=1 Tax=Saprospira sp. CCB-QB6 TaxID=3023936 RepID=UPI002349E0AF|nr:FMN-binding negative transcriptional regulator [Saprospira sp. CCB-QB6]WCL82959.1 FMN-binding negative transcriptional regulator [Saprospira sp. CCB-QB6]
MYIPKSFKSNSPAQLQWMKEQYPFGLLQSQQEGQLWATALPFVWSSPLLLKSHLALANPQAQSFLKQDKQEVLIHFQGPYAYISPKHYLHARNVPTWNYLALQVRGQLSVLDQLAQKQLLEESILAFEPSYWTQWEKLPNQYLEALAGELLAFQIEVTDIDLCLKISQNKSQAEQLTILKALQSSAHLMDQQLAQAILQLQPLQD